jgi:hypothetical protein
VFCPRCGTPHEPDAAFCERCGERLAGEQAATPDAAPSPIPPPPAAGTSSPPPFAAPPPAGGDASGRRTWLLAGGVVVVLVAVAAILALTGVFSGDDEHASSVLARTLTRPAPAAVPTTPAVTTETVPDAAPATTTLKPAVPRAVSATVARTCGRDGVGGDCHLSVRTQPASGATELDRLDEGDTLRLSCQVRGESVRSSALGASSTVWSRTTSGGYVSNVYVKGPRLKSQTITLRRC